MAKINMSEVLGVYGYNDTPTKLVSQKTKEQQEQHVIDIHQNIRIEENSEVNQLQDAFNNANYVWFTLRWFTKLKKIIIKRGTRKLIKTILVPISMLNN